MENYWPVIASLLGGGAVGALITAFITTYRNRIQPVNYKFEVKQLFGGVLSGAADNVKITISEDGQLYEFTDLMQISLKLYNEGNKDLTQFYFSISLPDGCEAILLNANDTDRSHRFVEKPEISPIARLKALDFQVAPFNRGDTYELMAYVTGQPTLVASDIELTSPDPIRFVTGPSGFELAAQAGLIALQTQVPKQVGLSTEILSALRARRR